MCRVSFEKTRPRPYESTTYYSATARRFTPARNARYGKRIGLHYDYLLHHCLFFAANVVQLSTYSTLTLVKLKICVLTYPTPIHLHLRTGCWPALEPCCMTNAACRVLCSRLSKGTRCFLVFTGAISGNVGVGGDS